MLHDLRLFLGHDPMRNPHLLYSTEGLVPRISELSLWPPTGGTVRQLGLSGERQRLARLSCGQRGDHRDRAIDRAATDTCRKSNRDQKHDSVCTVTGRLGRVPVLFALLAALSNALNVTVMQHVACIGDPRHSKGWGFVRYLLSNPLWLFGWVALAGAFVFQAIALHNGAVSVVQPLLVTELVFALVLRWLWLHQRIRPVTWWAAVLTCISLDTLDRHGRAQRWQCPFPPAEPGCLPPRDSGRRGDGTGLLLRTAWPAGEAGRVAWRVGVHALGACGHIHQGDDRHAGAIRRVGYVHALAGLRAGRHGTGGGVLEPGCPPCRAAQRLSQPFIVIVDPVVSIVLSVWIFGETFTRPVCRPSDCRLVRLRRDVRRRDRAGPHRTAEHGP